MTMNLTHAQTRFAERYSFVPSQRLIRQTADRIKSGQSIPVPSSRGLHWISIGKTMVLAAYKKGEIKTVLPVNCKNARGKKIRDPQCRPKQLGGVL